MNKEFVINLLKQAGATDIRIEQYGELSLIIDKENGKWHISMSHPKRLPTYNEMKEVRYKFLPDECYMAQIFPPTKDFVNVHPNTLHLYEI